MIGVLRIGHRIARDKRITTHVFLAARTLGADFGVLSGERDDAVLRSVERISEKWGGAFSVRYEKNWRGVLEKWKGGIAHLTMYGMPLDEKIGELRKEKNLLVVVGAEKVPGEAYALADYNVAVTNQPHSEVAALAIFLDRFFRGSELRKNFSNAKLRIVPQERGKLVQQSNK
jgi:tRNA (cytidine56-2'-O)-methyltransferase